MKLVHSSFMQFHLYLKLRSRCRGGRIQRKVVVTVTRYQEQDDAKPDAAYDQYGPRQDSVEADSQPMFFRADIPDHIVGPVRHIECDVAKCPIRSGAKGRFRRLAGEVNGPTTMIPVSVGVQVLRQSTGACCQILIITPPFTTVDSPPALMHVGVHDNTSRYRLLHLGVHPESVRPLHMDSVEDFIFVLGFRQLVTETQISGARHLGLDLVFPTCSPRSGTCLSHNCACEDTEETTSPSGGGPSGTIHLFSLNIRCAPCLSRVPFYCEQKYYVWPFISTLI